MHRVVHFFDIKAILNFAPVILIVPEEVVIDNINLSNKPEGIIYNIGILVMR